MPGYIQAQPVGSGFQGAHEIYQYTNADGLDPNTVCGQAACATLLTYVGAQPANIDTLRRIEKSHHPDVLFGALGTSPWRIQAILEAYGARSCAHVSKEPDLKDHVASSRPVICLIQNTGGLLGLGDGAHWFVVFAYDDAGVFVTNYGPTVQLTWKDFRDKWDSPTSWIASVDFKAITAMGRVLPSGTKASGGGLGGGGGRAW
jgi:Peptidase_C39 like family